MDFVTLIKLPENQQATSGDPHQVVKQVLQDSGGREICSRATLGRYDLIVVASFPAQENAFKAWSSAKLQHGWITETLTADTLEQYASIYKEVETKDRQPQTRR